MIPSLPTLLSPNGLSTSLARMCSTRTKTLVGSLRVHVAYFFDDYDLIRSEAFFFGWRWRHSNHRLDIALLHLLLLLPISMLLATVHEFLNSEVNTQICYFSGSICVFFRSYLRVHLLFQSLNLSVQSLMCV
jgi:hypothetical protein